MNKGRGKGKSKESYSLANNEGLRAHEHAHMDDSEDIRYQGNAVSRLPPQPAAPPRASRETWSQNQEDDWADSCPQAWMHNAAVLRPAPRPLRRSSLNCAIWSRMLSEIPITFAAF